MGGEVERNVERNPKVNTSDLGEDLIGMDFWDSESVDSEMKRFTVTGTSKRKIQNKNYDCVDYQLADGFDDPLEKDMFSTVPEVRKWMDNTPPPIENSENRAGFAMGKMSPYEYPAPDQVQLTTKSLF